MMLIHVKKDLVESDKVKIARIVVALITLLGIREEVYRMLR